MRPPKAEFRPSRGTRLRARSRARAEIFGLGCIMRPPRKLIFADLPGAMGHKMQILHVRRIMDNFGKTSANIVRTRVPPLQDSKEGHQKWRRSLRHSGVRVFSEFSRRGTRCLIRFLQNYRFRDVYKCLANFFLRQ